ncbi:MAG: chromate efflux transporter [Caulobacteraceae bacterium]
MENSPILQETPSPDPRRRVPLGDIVRYFLRLGALRFGGPVALCGLMERELVEAKGWLTKAEMREAIAASQSLPGPLAIQVGIFVSYMRGGFWGAWAGGWAFILPNFLMVAALGALYVHFGGLPWMTALFYGVSPVVIALILHSCWRLSRLGMEHWQQWAIATAAFLVTVVFKAEVAVLFLCAGAVGVAYYGTLFRRRPPQALAIGGLVAPAGVASAAHAAGPSVFGKLILFFLKASSLTFGSGLVIVPFLEKGLVQENGWLSPRDFLIAVAIGMMSPGPVVITATFVGFLVAGFWGSLASTIAIFLPSFVLVLLVAPLLQRHRNNPNVQGFIKGTYGAAIGTIGGASVLLAKVAIGDALTGLIAVVALGLLFRFRIANPILIAGAAVVGLIAFPWLRPAWVMIK